MKLGLLHEENKKYPPGQIGRLRGISSADTVWQLQLPLLFPEDNFYIIDINNPDFDLMGEIDLLFHMSNCMSDPTIVKFIDQIPCKIVAQMPYGYLQLCRYPSKQCLIEKYVLDASDYVISMDYDYTKVVSLFTTSYVFWWPLPYPVDRVLDSLSWEDNAARYGSCYEYDIIVPYNPFASANSQRNSYTSALVANKIVNTIDGYNNIGIFGRTNSDNPKWELMSGFLKDLGCENFKMLPYMSGENIVRTFARAKLVVNLDDTRAAGRFAIETALARVPVIMSDSIPQARYIYDNGLQNPYDVETALNAARMIAVTGWEESRLDRAFQRAMDFRPSNAARILEELCNEAA